MKKQKIEIKNRMTAWVVWSNTDLTDGRGDEYPLALCLKETTARRIAKGRYVQGTDCRITQSEIFFIGKAWYGPAAFTKSTQQDLDEEARIESEKLAAAKKQAAIEKARAAGLSDEDLEALKA